MKHTSGEWEVHPIEEANGNSIVIMGGVQINICELHDWEYTGNNEKEASEEFEANAKIIADSPLMFEYILKKANAGDEEAKKIIARHA